MLFKDHRAIKEKITERLKNAVNSSLTHTLLRRTALLTNTVFNSPFFFTFFPSVSYENNSRKRTALLTDTFFQFARVDCGFINGVCFKNKLAILVVPCSILAFLTL